VPSGDLAEIFARALTLLVEDAKRKKFAQTSRPAPRNRSKTDERKPASRHIPNSHRDQFAGGWLILRLELPNSPPDPCGRPEPPAEAHPSGDLISVQV
jgi:hypothetical protein